MKGVAQAASSGSHSHERVSGRKVSSVATGISVGTGAAKDRSATATLIGPAKTRASDAVKVVAIALASRLVVLLVAALANAWFSAGPRSVGAISALRHGSSLFAPHSVLGLIFGSWGNWDGAWFTSIAARGYVRAGGPAFFPLYPLTMRVFAPLVGGHYVIAGVLLSLLFFALACLLLYRLLAEQFSREIALWSVVFLCVFPTSFFFGAVYSESLFLLLSVACFFCARAGRFWLAGLAGAGAALTRNSGLLLLIPMAMYYLDSRGWRPRRLDRRAAALALVPAGLAIYMAYLWARFGDPLYFLKSEDRWRRTFELPVVTLYRAAVEFATSVRRLIVVDIDNLSTLHNLLAFVVVMAALAMVILGWRRLPRPYTAYAVASLLLPLCYPERTMPLMSMARFVLVVFPLFAALALVTTGRPRLRLVIVLVSLAGLVWLTAVFALRATFIG